MYKPPHRFGQGGGSVGFTLLSLWNIYVGMLFVPHVGSFAFCLSVDMFNQEHSLTSSSAQHATSILYLHGFSTFVWVDITLTSKVTFRPWCLARQPGDPGRHPQHLSHGAAPSCLSGILRPVHKAKSSPCTTKCFSGPQ